MGAAECILALIGAWVVTDLVAALLGWEERPWKL